MPISRYACKFSARWFAGALLAVLLVFTPAVGTGFLPRAAQAQDAIDFRAALDGYGQWVQHPRWGEVWIPDQRPADWQPYRLGHWAYTDEWGWYWDSEEDFGWVTYHYGRWMFDSGLGWIWVPGTEWGPAWVDWRQGDDFVGWAPLPLDEAIDEDYETPDIYMFVRAGDLLAPRAYDVFLSPRERFAYYNRSFLVNRSVLLRGMAASRSIPACRRPSSRARAGIRFGRFHRADRARRHRRRRGRDHPARQLPRPGTHARLDPRRQPFRSAERSLRALEAVAEGRTGTVGGSAPLAARGVGIETSPRISARREVSSRTRVCRNRSRRR